MCSVSVFKFAGRNCSMFLYCSTSETHKSEASWQKCSLVLTTSSTSTPSNCDQICARCVRGQPFLQNSWANGAWLALTTAATTTQIKEWNTSQNKKKTFVFISEMETMTANKKEAYPGASHATKNFKIQGRPCKCEWVCHMHSMFSIPSACGTI